MTKLRGLVNVLSEVIGRASKVAGGGLATPLMRARLWCYWQALQPASHFSNAAALSSPPFTGQRIIDEAHQITRKVVERISHATLASLTAKPIDDIVQALYNEHCIHLPVLDRNGAEHEEFEFFYAPQLRMRCDLAEVGSREHRPGRALDRLREPQQLLAGASTRLRLRPDRIPRFEGIVVVR